tara:strand:- start:15 stop:218 length:204 start_codon:yes stop_codon:yes gene_type:complete
MKKIMFAVLILSLVFVVGCQEAVPDTLPTEVSSEETTIDDSLEDLEELDALDRELDLDFDEMESYLE